jgi:hypothetical protein
MAALRKSRKKGPRVNVEHTTYGPGELIEKKITDSNQAILVVRFAGGVRSLLASSEFWITPAAQFTTIPVAKMPAAQPVEIEHAETELVA